jgi:transcriptional regulator with XRE-family HTH domain
MKKNTLATYLKDLRIRLGLTQQQIADTLGINRSYYSLLESGKRSNIRIGLVKKISVLANEGTITIYNLRGK